MHEDKKPKWEKKFIQIKFCKIKRNKVLKNKKKETYTGDQKLFFIYLNNSEYHFPKF